MPDLPVPAEGEARERYRARLLAVPFPAGEGEGEAQRADRERVVRGWWLRLFDQHQPGPNNAATAYLRQADELTGPEREALAGLRARMREVQMTYDRVLWEKGAKYWRTAQRSPEEAEREYRKELAARGLSQMEIDAEIAQAKRDTAKMQRDINVAVGTVGSVAGVLAGSGGAAIVSAITASAAAAAVVPVVGWVVAACAAVLAALTALISSLIPPPDRKPGAWREWRTRVEDQHRRHLETRREGVDTYRGFTAAGVEEADDPQAARRQVVDRRLFTLSLTIGVDLLALFPVLPFGTVVRDPWLVDGIPEISELDAIAIDQKRRRVGGAPPPRELDVGPLDFRDSPFRSRSRS